MIPLNLSMDSSMGVTVLSNTFIDNYMKDANDAQIKIYLFLLRMVGSGLPTDLNEISDKFNLTESDVLKSLKHWEQLGLIGIARDDAQRITGIAFKEGNGRVSEVNPVKKISAPIITAPGSMTMFKIDYENEKNSYSLEDIQRLKSNPEVSILLQVAAQYFGRPLNPSEIKSLLFIYDRLAFSEELLDYLLEYCIDGGHKSIHYIEQVAIGWYEEGVDTPEKARSSVKKSDKKIAVIMGYFGLKKEPAPCELKLFHKWIFDYGFSNMIIEEACSRAVLNSNTGKSPVPYADAILTRWFENGVKTKSDITKLDEAHEEIKKTVTERKATPSGNNFTQIEKNDYDFDALERAALYHIN